MIPECLGHANKQIMLESYRRLYAKADDRLVKQLIRYLDKIFYQ